jgi:hypothetical protein
MAVLWSRHPGPGRTLPRRAVPAAVLGCLVLGCLSTGCGAAAAPGGTPGGAPAPSGTGPGTGPAAGASQVFFDPADLATPDSRAVLAGPPQVAGYLRWLGSGPRPASPRLVAALRQYRFDGSVLVVVARTVGCDSVGRVALVRTGADLAVAAQQVSHHPECLRANHLVAVFALAAPAVPAGTTIDGAPPRTSWP